jgi:hypothetical protein
LQVTQRGDQLCARRPQLHQYLTQHGTTLLERDAIDGLLKALLVRQRGGSNNGSSSFTCSQRRLNLCFSRLARRADQLEGINGLMEFHARPAASQAFPLSRAEVLNIANVLPVSQVEMFQLVDKCDERLTDEQVSRRHIQQLHKYLQSMPL